MEFKRFSVLLVLAVFFCHVNISLSGRLEEPRQSKNGLQQRFTSDVSSKLRYNRLAIKTSPSTILAAATTKQISTKKGPATTAVGSNRLMSSLTARLLLILASTMYGSNYVSTKLLQENLPASLVTFFRFSIASIFFLPSVLTFRGDFGAIWGSIELGIWCAIGFISQAKALNHTSASKVAFACGLGVIMPPLFDLIADVWNRKFGKPAVVSTHVHAGGKQDKKFGWGKISMPPTMTPPPPPPSEGTSLFNRNWGKSKIIPPLLAIIGAAILEWNGLEEPADMSDIFLLLTPFSFAMCFWKSQDHSRVYPNDTGVITGTMLSTVSVITFLWALWADDLPSGPKQMSVFFQKMTDWSVYVPLLYTGVGTTAWTSYIEQRALQVLSATDTTLIYTLEPIFATFFACRFLGESFTWSTGIGGAFIVLGTLWKEIYSALSRG